MSDGSGYFHRWAPIADLPENWDALKSPSLRSMELVWLKERQRLANDAAMNGFLEKVKREWSIETGIIEQLYSISDGTTKTLIELGIRVERLARDPEVKDAEYVMRLLEDQKGVVEGIFTFVGEKRSLTRHFINELHQALLKHQPYVEAVDQFGNVSRIKAIVGRYKEQPNSVRRADGRIHEYCSPLQVESEMDNLIRMHTEHVNRGVCPEVEAAWLHHRFTQIHPYQDGNGRIARALATIVFVRAGWFPLVIRRTRKKEYFSALELADKGDLKPLIEFFSGIQRDIYRMATSEFEDVTAANQPDQRIASLIEAIRAQEMEREQKQTEYASVFAAAKSLESHALKRLEELAESLKRQLGKKCWVRGGLKNNAQDSLHWYSGDMWKIANDRTYHPNTKTYYRWIRLNIEDQRNMELVISFHALGVRFSGVMVASAFLLFRDRDDSEDPGSSTLKSLFQPGSVDGPYACFKELFEFNYQEGYAAVETRFSPWLEDVIVLALDQWRKKR